jgi:hypothetical protein
VFQLAVDRLRSPASGDVQSTGNATAQSVVAPVPMETPQARAKRRSKFERIAAECLDTEKAYVKNLNILIDQYLKPLRLGPIAQKLGLPKEDLNALFSNIEIILAYHQVLVMDMETEPDLCEVFLKNAPFLKVYTQYVSGYDKLLQVMARLTHKNRQFQQFLHDKQKSGTTCGLDIMAFFIMPVQRLPRYELLLRELIRHADPDP